MSEQPPPPPEGPYGQQPPAYGQQPAYGQPQFGQPQFGQPQFGQPYGQQPYGPPSQGVPATMGKRLLARILDGLIIGIPLTVLAGVILLPVLSSVETDSAGNVTSGDEALAGAVLGVYGLFFLVTIGYEIILIAVRGATLGKSILRYLIPVAGSFACGIGWLVVILSPLWDNTHRNQGWQDKVAKTLVVQR